MLSALGRFVCRGSDHDGRPVSVLLWGVLSMIPLTVTIGFIYGFIGFIGKDYDMPVAILSSLTLGIVGGFCHPFSGTPRTV